MTPIEFGGAERVNLNFLKNVDRDKYDIHLILLTRPWEDENIFIKFLGGKTYPIYKVPVAIRPITEGRDYFRVLRSHRKIYSILKKNSFDIVHTHGYFADIVGIPAAKMLGIPVISTCHGYISKSKSVVIYNIIDRIALKFSNRIIAVSEGIKENLLKNGIRENRIEVIVNAVPVSADPSAFRRDRENRRARYGIIETDFVAGYIGRLSQEKGIKYLLEAAGSLDGSGIPLKVLIIGDGPQRKELEDIVMAKGIEGMVIFAGFQSDIESWLPALDVFILPSLTEGTPMALLEAMSFGIPAIASRVGGVPDVVADGENGILFEAGNSRELIQALKILFNEPSLHGKIGQNAKKTIMNKYNIHSWCRTIEGQYDRLIKEYSL